MCRKFQDRGYPRRLVEKHKNRVLHNIREESGERHDKQTGRRIPFVATYCETSPRIAKIINKYWPILQQTYSDIEDFQNRPIMSYRRAQNLKDRLVKTLVPSTGKRRQLTLGKLRNGSFQCLNCVNCAQMHKGEVFVHPGTGVEYKLRHHMTCTTEWVVYAMWCPCGLQPV